MENKITSHLVKGVIIAGILIALDGIQQKLYGPVPDGVRYMARLIITFVGVLAGCIIFIKQTGSKPSFGEVFSHGFRTTAVIAFLMAAYTFIAVKFIYPPPSTAEMEAAVKAIEAQGNALHEEARQLAAKAAANRWVVYVSFTIFASLIPGLLASALGGGIAKKNQ